MQNELLSRNVALVCQQGGIAPQQFSQRWLVLNEIATDPEFDNSPVRDSNVLVPVASKQETEHFQFLALPDRIQISIRQGVAVSDIEPRIQKLLTGLNGTVWLAIGLNFIYKISASATDDLAAEMRRRFLGQSAFESELGVDGTACGFFAFRQELNGLLKIEIRPSRVEGRPALVIDHVAADFNFHYEFGNSNFDRTQMARSALLNWGEAATRAEGLAASLTR